MAWPPLKIAPTITEPQPRGYPEAAVGAATFVAGTGAAIASKPFVD